MLIKTVIMKRSMRRYHTTIGKAEGELVAAVRSALKLLMVNSKSGCELLGEANNYTTTRINQHSPSLSHTILTVAQLCQPFGASVMSLSLAVNSGAKLISCAVT